MKNNPSLRSHIKQALIFFLVAALLTCVGAWFNYTYGYKDGFWIEMMSYVPVILGWLCFLYPLVILHISIKNGRKTSVSLLRKVAHGLFFVVYLAWLVALVAGLVKLGMMAEERVDRILASDEVRSAKAKVTRVEERRRKSTTRIYAIIEYNTEGEKIQQAIRDGGLYMPGQEIDIKYSVKYPDMFKVVSPYDR
jgi:hypothetical protein